MIKRISNFYKYPFVLKKTVLETILYSFWFEICLKLNWYSYTKNLENNTFPIPQNQDDNSLIINQVHKGIKVVQKYALWKPKCHNLAITGKKLLRKRGIGTTIHVGFKKKKNKEIEGHAWLTHCDKVIVGFIKDLDKYKTLDRQELKD